MPSLWRALLPLCGLVFSFLAPFSQADDYQVVALRVATPWSQALPPNAPTVAVYFTVRNQGVADDRLLGVETPIAAEAQMHQHVGADGMMKMERVDSVIVPAGGQARFAPMGNHVMLLGLQDRSSLVEGGSFPLTLRFQHAGDLQVQVQVLAMPPSDNGSR
ncbi:copper chaperone PCu(A)C [Pseudomonas sp. DC3000-4b1]|uniref:copper chaperone PCu(A)C n=1 Tax=unclassified Pseudomonas TaxID=196821 RepID=UPI003CE75F3A